MKQLHCRIPAALKPYLANLDIGLRTILIRWQMPEPVAGDRLKCLVRIPDEWHRQIAEIAQQTGLPKNAVVVAALQLASHSTFNPRPEIPRDTPLNRGRPPQRAKSASPSL